MIGSQTFSINGWNVGVLIVGYAVSLFGGRLMIEPVVDKLWKKYVPGLHRFSELVKYASLIESFLYTTSVLVGYPEFVAVWVVIKMAGQWTPTKTDLDRPLFHIFLIGNGLSIIISAGAAFLMKLMFQP